MQTADRMAGVPLSLVLCARNDGHQGNPVWRLQTTLEYTARQAAHLGRLDQLEIIVADWGSEHPLRDAVQLGPDAAAIVRFMTVPPTVARAEQRDSPFAEVLAINAAARRARGQYIGRIDQDTLVGRRFLRWFFETLEHPTPDFRIDTTAMIVKRQEKLTPLRH